MKKDISFFTAFLIFISILFLIFVPSSIKAQVNCPSQPMSCSQLAQNGGCAVGCKTLRSTSGRNICTCIKDDSNPLKNGKEGDCIDTAIGCIPITEQQDFVTFILKWAIGIAGGIAFILIVISSFQIMTSQGDPKRLQAGKELLSSAIMGLILLIFSVFILRIIGVEILKIPGLS